MPGDPTLKMSDVLSQIREHIMEAAKLAKSPATGYGYGARPSSFPDIFVQLRLVQGLIELNQGEIDEREARAKAEWQHPVE